MHTCMYIHTFLEFVRLCLVMDRPESTWAEEKTPVLLPHYKLFMAT